MPLYCFACKNCEHVFEITASMKEAPLEETCPVCGETGYRDFRSERSGVGSVDHGFWSRSCGALPMEWIRECHKQRKDPTKTKVIDHQGFKLRPDGCAWIPNKATWKTVKKARGAYERDAYYG